LTAVGKSSKQDDILFGVKEATKEGYAIAKEGDSINLSVPDSKTRRGRIGHGIAQTLDTGMQQYTIQPAQWRRTEKGKAFRREAQKNGKDLTPFNDGHRELVPKDSDTIGAITSQAIAKDSLLFQGARVRRLTPTECCRLQGLSDDWLDFGANEKGTYRLSDSAKYKLAGNGVSVPVVKAILKNLFTYLET